jgi:tRNA1Val (adenine37-N6)-methyltransferase
MMSTGFRCKQFFVDHGDCAMKVSTDALLLGAWTQVPAQGAVLDIGCGSGILSLMLAQRCAQSLVDAIELDATAAVAAAKNFAASPFAAQLRLIQGDILTYPASADHLSERRYQLIISNPPFFVEALKSTDARRQQARHTDTLPFAALLQVAADLLSRDGKFSLVLPCVEAEQLLVIALDSGWQLERDCWVQSIPTKAPLRRLLTIGRKPLHLSSASKSPQPEQLLIRELDGQYSAGFRQLLKDFYLKF